MLPDNVKLYLDRTQTQSVGPEPADLLESEARPVLLTKTGVAGTTSQYAALMPISVMDPLYGNDSDHMQLTLAGLTFKVAHNDAGKGVNVRGRHLARFDMNMFKSYAAPSEGGYEASTAKAAAAYLVFDIPRGLGKAQEDIAWDIFSRLITDLVREPEFFVRFRQGLV